MAIRISESRLVRVASAHERKPLPTTDTKGSPRERFNKALYSQVLQARRLLVSEAGSAQERIGA